MPRSPRGWDVLATIAVLAAFAITWPTLFVTHQVADSIAPLVAAAGAAPLVLLRTQPFAGWASSAVVALMVAISLEPLPEYGFPWPVPHFLVLLALLVAVALRASAREIGIMWAGTTALFLVFMPGDLRAGWAVGGTMLTVVALLVRWLVLSRRELARQEQVSELERARRAVLEERSRIARDLHDVVAHSMSLVVVQAQERPAAPGWRHSRRAARVRLHRRAGSSGPQRGPRHARCVAQRRPARRGASPTWAGAGGAPAA
ncbi:histidine kinase [Nocardioides pakistanensis]